MAARRPSATSAAQERRDRIIESTRALLRERDAVKVIVVDIAALADVAPATVYNLVGSRDEVMRAVLEAAVSDVTDRVEPVDETRPVESVVTLLTTAAEVLLEDAIAHRRAIGAMSDTADDGWLETTMGELLEDRLAVVAAAFDGSIPLARLAELIHVAFRGALISWSYGHLSDDLLAPTSEQLALHILGTTARPDIAFEIKRRLIALTKEAR